MHVNRKHQNTTRKVLITIKTERKLRRECGWVRLVERQRDLLSRCIQMMLAATSDVSSVSVSARFGASVAWSGPRLLPVVIHVVHKSAPAPAAVVVVPPLILEKMWSDTTAPM